MDGIVFKVRQGGKIINQRVMTDLKARGVEDILITITDNLNGFTQAITNIFPEATTQICVVPKLETQQDM